MSLHGDGFIQLALQGDMRLHVWHPDLPKCSCLVDGSIHDHRFSFTSHVLVGSQRNMQFQETTPEPATRTTFIAYGHRGERKPCGSRPWTPLRELSLNLEEDIITPAGGWYHQNAFRFHKSIPAAPDGKGATLMRKEKILNGDATSLRPKGVTPDEDFDRHQMSENAMWAIIIDVLGTSESVIA